jgi:hypothetical protein
VRHLALGLLLTTSVTSACVGSADCETAPLVPVEESAAAERATQCAPDVEFRGRTYFQHGCEAPVRGSLLGPVEARNAAYAARAIEGVPPSTALAIRERQKKVEGCRGWLLWAATDRDQHELINLARRVNTTAELD